MLVLSPIQCSQLTEELAKKISSTTPTLGDKGEETQPDSDQDGVLASTAAIPKASEQRSTEPALSATTARNSQAEQTGHPQEVLSPSEAFEITSGSRLSPTIVPDMSSRKVISATIGPPEAADFSIIMPELDKLRTFPTSVPLPDLDGDLEFLDFFDPFLGLQPKQVEACALPPLTSNIDRWSPLETFSTSSQASIHDYGFHQAPIPASTESQSAEPGGSALQASNPAAEHVWPHDLPQLEAAPTSTLSGLDAYQSPLPQKPVPEKHRGFNFTEEMRVTLMEDLTCRLSVEQLHGFRMPGTTALQKCLRTYLDAFHVHMPIFHLPTMNLANTPSPLVLAICAIGALYRLERKVAASLYLKADQALCATIDRRGRPHKKPRLLEDWSLPPAEEPPSKSYQEYVWPSQTRLLLAMFACFSGDPEVIAKAIVQLGEFLIVSIACLAALC